ncbi:hypothetical protein FJ651_12340 [Paucihalobacter ruber]|uniref:Uncharacterized protein n=1 Tax=Paucihalobacter ruber TaxID=2567861 RepID=A0A506PFR6_9FLAO|nr:hypothetical protein [Paucihalobacter ruber]TPV32348.1 hypothetical protein FJ651_12340 [Paucihalobacter ruber]
MTAIWKKIKTLLKSRFNSKKKQEKPDYLFELVNNVKEAKRLQKNLPFQIVSAKRKGFVVKVGGLFAFVSYFHMPWTYKSLDHWLAVSKHLIGKEFFCIIYSIDDNDTPVKVIIDAENHTFKPKELKKLQEYECIVIQKSKYGMFVDLGYHFNWEFGSFVGLIHKTVIKNDVTLIEAVPGDVVTTYFHGLQINKPAHRGELILGTKNLQKEWFTEDLQKLVGTEQTAILKEEEDGRRTFYIDGKFKTFIHINKDNLKIKRSNKRALKSLNANSTITCKVMRISKNHQFVSEFIKINESQ